MTYKTTTAISSAQLSSAQLSSAQLSSAQLSSAQLSSAQLSSAQLSSAQLSVPPRSDKGVVCLENLGFFEAPEHIKAQFETRFQRGSNWAFDFYAKSRCRYS